MASDKLLLPEASTSVFQPRLAAWIGLNESILLQHVHYLAGKPDFGAVADGVKWVRMTILEWIEELPCFDERTIRRTLQNLEEDGLLSVTTFSGRSKWYRVNYEILQGIEGPIERLQNRTKARAKASTKALEAKHNATGQNDHIEDTTGQNGQLQLVKMDSPTGQNGQLPRPLSKNKLSKDNSGKKPLEIREDNRQRDGPKTILAKEFTALTGIEFPTNDKPSEKFWWGKLQVIYKLAGEDVEVGKKLMREAINRREVENVYTPNSLINTIRKIVAEKNHKPRISLK